MQGKCVEWPAARLFPMIRVIVQHRRAAVQLLGEQYAHQLVRKVAYGERESD